MFVAKFSDTLHEYYCARTKTSDKYLTFSAEIKNKPANHRDSKPVDGIFFLDK